MSAGQILNKSLQDLERGYMSIYIDGNGERRTLKFGFQSFAEERELYILQGGEDVLGHDGLLVGILSVLVGSA